VKPKRRRFPVKLSLLPGLRWSGKVVITGPSGEGYAAQFDAEIVGAAAGEARIVYDHAVLSRKQVKEWTGVDLG
jgi:hypothetical protein